MKKRVFSAVMAASLVWSAFSVPALAATDTEINNGGEDKTNSAEAGGNQAGIGGVDTKEHKEHFRVVVPVAKNIYQFTVDPEKNGKMSALVTNSAEKKTVYFDRTAQQKWWGQDMPKNDLMNSNAYYFSNASDLFVVTNIGSSDVRVSVQVTPITANSQSVLDLGLRSWVNGPIENRYPNGTVEDTWVEVTDHTTVRDGEPVKGVWSVVNGAGGSQFYPEEIPSFTLRREGGHTNQFTDAPAGSGPNGTITTTETTDGYLSWKVEDKTTYFDNATKEIKEVDRTTSNLDKVESLAFQVVGEASGKGWAPNQQARFALVWRVTDANSILPHVLTTKEKISNWNEAHKIKVNLGDGELKATAISGIYMVYGRDNNEMRLDDGTGLWCTGAGPVNGTEAEITISETTMKNIAAMDLKEGQGSWIPVMFKIVYTLKDGETAESYVWFY